MEPKLNTQSTTNYIESSSNDDIDENTCCVICVSITLMIGFNAVVAGGFIKNAPSIRHLMH